MTSGLPTLIMASGELRSRSGSGGVVLLLVRM